MVGCNNTIIPYGVEEIDEGAFGYCMELTEITIPESVLTIGNNAFHRCESLQSITVPNTIKSIGENAFSSCISLPIEDNARYAGKFLLEVVDKSLTECKIREDTLCIFSEAFSGCSQLASIDIPNSVVSIGAESFFGCSSLTSIRLPNNIRIIRDYTFFGCSALKSIIIPDSVTVIECSAFQDCTSLQTIHLSNSLKRIESGAFNGCHSLTSVQLPNQLKEIWGSAIKDCSSLKEIIIPENVKSVGAESFRGCSSLASVILRDGVENIGRSAFSYTALSSILLPDSLLKIDEYAFSHCNNLKSITIPERTESIRYGVFSNCQDLEAIHIHVKNPAVADPNIGEDSVIVESEEGTDYYSENTQVFIHLKAFDGIDFERVILYVPTGAEKTYKTHPAFQKFKIIKTEDFFDTSEFFYSDNGKSICGVCDLLRSTITIPDTVFRIDDLAFNGCTELGHITIPACISTIGKDLFDGCEKLSTIKVASGNSVYDSRNDCNAIIKTDANILVAGCGNSVIPDSVTAIASYAFKGSSLKRITIPASITSIGQDAFKDCSNLQEIHIQITMPNKLVVNAYEFKGVDFDSCVLFVPRGCLVSYRSHPAFCQFKKIQIETSYQ